MKTAALTAAIVAGLATTASAQTILSFGFTDLNGTYNNGTSTFTAVGVNTPSLRTVGDVNRHIAPVATAQYDPGTAAGLVSLSLNVTNIVGNNASGSGSLFIEDADGDRFVADLTGSFTRQSPAVFFNALLSNIAFVPGPNTNNTFDGPSGGSFPLTFAPAQPPFTGASIVLFFDTPGTFFGQNFQDRPTQFHGAVIPTPATGLVFGLGVLAVARRRRR